MAKKKMLIRRNTRLFGLPYQFLPEVDPRIDTISKTLGRKFAENIIMDAPVITIIPGRPKYLPGTKDKLTTTQSMILAAKNNDLDPLKIIINDKTKSNEAFRYYDFEARYMEYIKYVNILCRTAAAMLEINEKLDGIPLQSYDWSKYKWNTESAYGTSTTEKLLNKLFKDPQAAEKYINENYADEDYSVNLSEVSASLDKKTKNQHELLYETTTNDYDESSLSMFDVLGKCNYVQFYIDPESSFSESVSNTTSESKLKGMFDSGSDMLKELAFMINSGGGDSAAFQEFLDNGMDSLAEAIPQFNGSVIGTATSAMSRVLSLTSNVLKGENVIMPDIYQSSSYDKSYSFTVHLKSPYGTKFGYYMDIVVPLMHLMALGIPKQTTANTYGSPFLIKAYCDGVCACNLGLVTGISVSKWPTDGTTTVDGLPTEVDVTVTIADLYSDLAMSPQSSPLLFINNDSLLDYLAVTCGLSFTEPDYSTKLKTAVNTIKNAFLDIDDNIKGAIYESMDNMIASFFGLRW